MARRRKAFSTEITTGEVTGFTHEGRGVIRHESRPVFVSGALKGETIRFQRVKQHRRYAEANVIEVIEPSPDRVTPHCPHANLCGGCSLQHLSSEKQILMKQDILIEQLENFGKVHPENILPPVVADAWNYRRKARLGVRYVEKKEKLLMGFREKSSRYLADLSTCKVLVKRAEELFLPLQAMIASLSIYQHIAQVELAAGDDAISFVLRNLASFTPEDLDTIVAFGQQHQVNMLIQPGNQDTIKKVWPEDDDIRLSYQIKGLTLHFSPTDFVQVNQSINEKLIDLLLEHLALTPDCRVLDLFCGLGNLSLPMAKYCGEVVGVEGCSRLTEKASANAAHNQLTNTQFYMKDLFTCNQAEPWFSGDYTKCVIDPPRSGALKVIQDLGTRRFEKLIYVSCNPATLARDADVLVNQQGYRLTHAGVLDMFPHTAHVESIAIFEPK